MANATAIKPTGRRQLVLDFSEKGPAMAVPRKTEGLSEGARRLAELMEMHGEVGGVQKLLEGAKKQENE